MIKKQYRQGDVFLVKVDAIPKEGLSKQDNTILAYGEVTGHKHYVEGRQVQVYQTQDAGRKYVEVQDEVAILKHDEHKEIALEKGSYLVMQQREYNPQANRLVQD